MDKIEKIREWVKKHKKEELVRNSIGVITGQAFFVDTDELLSFLDTISEESDKSPEEAAKEYLDKIFGEGKHQQFYKDLFIAGWKCRDDQMPMPEDTVLFNSGVAEGRRLEREDMMKDAVGGEVMTNGFYPYEPRIVAPYPNCPYAFGDKVRIVVLKAEEE